MGTHQDEPGGVESIDHLPPGAGIENVKLINEDIHYTNIRLYLCPHGDLHVDFAGHKYEKKENSTDLVSVEVTHPPSDHFPKYKTVEWNDITAKVEISRDGSTNLYISTTNTTMNCSYLIDHHGTHGNIVLHPLFFTLQFSPNGAKLLYLAEALLSPSLAWPVFSPNLGGDWPYSVRRPQLCVMDIVTRSITMYPLPTGYVAGVSLWHPDSVSIITVARKARYNPCPECTDQPTRLAQLDTTSGEVLFLSGEEYHVSQPVIIPGNTHILYFRNKLHTTHDDICHQAISDELSEGVYGEVLLLGEGLGGTITSNLATRYPEEFNHVILINPVLSLPSLIVSRPHYLRRIFTPAGPWFSPVDISSTWAVSPLARVGDMQAAVLIVTTHDTLTAQATVFDRKLRDGGVSSDHYQVEQGKQNKLDTVELMVRWAETHYQKYSRTCFLPHTTTTTSREPTTRQSSTSSTLEIKNQADKDITTRPVASSSIFLLPSCLPFIVISYYL